jgi:endonuclease/exonuclease/phosphatase family metal-dependent hydrolase
MTPPRTERDHGRATEMRELRLLSFNIQGGSATQRYRHYITRGLDSVLPHPRKGRNLKRVAELLEHFDVVALQEADGGSLRSGFLNQVQHLAEQAGFPYWSFQSNRRVGRVAESANGLLSRLEPVSVWDHRLPGRIPGRGALEARFGDDVDGLRVVIAHLALSPRARAKQLAYLAELIGQHRHLALMGDFNCTVESGELDALMSATRLKPARRPAPTFPSWRPRRAIDHILVTDGIETSSYSTIALRVSDHLPLALTITVPASCLTPPAAADAA